ncbi:hypothetical protein D3C73_791260 [compost metagenome]
MSDPFDELGKSKIEPVGLLGRIQRLHLRLNANPASQLRDKSGNQIAISVQRFG